MTSLCTDKRNPTVNANGPVFGQPEYSMDAFPILDPKTNTAVEHPAPIRDPDMHEMAGPGHAAMLTPLGPSAYWGTEKIWTSHFNNHNATLDDKGRVWMTAAFRDQKNEPSFCKKGSDHPSAKLAPLNESSRMLTVYDPKTQKAEFVDTCFTTHHLNFASDANNTLWTSSGGGGGVVGWVNTKVWDETPRRGQGARLDCARSRHQRERQAGRIYRAEPTFRRHQGSPRRAGFLCGDGQSEGRVRVGYDPEQSRCHRAHQPWLEPAGDCDLGNLQCTPAGFGPRGGDIDSNGVVWVSLGSGHMGASTAANARARSMVRKRLATSAPKAGLSTSILVRALMGSATNSAESSYYSWVDQHNTFGLGNDVPLSTANLTDGLVALKDGQMISLRVPYPMGFYAKGLDGRIDDPNAGWKGRGLWASSGDRAPWQTEGGKGNKPMAVHFQLRPDPLAH